MCKNIMLMKITNAIKDPVYTNCWNCGHAEWFDYNNPRKTKPKICPKCGKMFMSKMDKDICDELIRKLEGV